MNFRIKCLMQTVFGLFKNKEELNYFAQKHISKKLPPSREVYERKFSQALVHHEAFQKYGNTANANVYEIGCGWHLAMALAFSTLGYSSVKALDVTCHVKKELAETILKYLSEDKKIAVQKPLSDDIKKELHDRFKIDLLAPLDSANTGFEEKSIDFIYSQEVFEHIPSELIPSIMKECRRVLKDDGVISMCINYADHYCSVDKSITEYNFLQYSEKSWKKYNPELHFVNRMRHTDFIRIFEQEGFEIIEETVIRPDGWETMLEGISLSEEFKTYTKEEISITSANIVMKKKAIKL